jgi:hypothetical protein
MNVRPLIHVQFCTTPKSTGLRAVFFVLTAIAAGLAGLSFAISVFWRGVMVDQAFFLLVAQQWALGRKLYVDLGDVHPPPFYMLHVIPIYLSNATGWPLVLSFNLIMSLLVVLSGVLVALASSRLRVLTGTLWITAIILVANDYIFANREYLFMLAWVPYVMARAGHDGTPSHATLVGAGAFAGFMICIKPHFALISAGVEAWLWLFHRSRSRLLPFVSFIVSAAVQVVIFLLFFDIVSYFYDLGMGVDYYSVIGLPNYANVLKTLLTNGLSLYSLLVCVVAVIFISKSSSIRALVEAFAVTVGTATLLIILQGWFRPYYLALLYAPAIGLSIVWILHGPSHIMGPHPFFRQLVYVVTALLALCYFWRISDYDSGIRRRAYQRYFEGYRVYAFGPLDGDPFMEYVERRVPPSDVVSVMGSYGQKYQDPIVSMVRLGRPVPSRYPGLEYAFALTLHAGNMAKANEAAKNIKEDLERSGVEWLFVRQGDEDPPAANFADNFKKFPVLGDWFAANFVAADRFDKYVVYRRKAPTR